MSSSGVNRTLAAQASLPGLPNAGRALQDTPTEHGIQASGSMAAAWLDERREGVTFVARGSGRPLGIGEGEGLVIFASTEQASSTRCRRFARDASSAPAFACWHR